MRGLTVTDSALQQFIRTVREHYALPDAPPLLLSRFGHKNRELLKALKDEFGTLKKAVDAAGEQNIRFIDTRAGQEAIAPTDRAADLQAQLQEDSASIRSDASLFGALPVSVQIAFCLRTETGEYVAIDIVRPFHYAKVSEPGMIRATQRIIPDIYRKPGLGLRTSSTSERGALWRQFLAWAEWANVDHAVFRRSEASNALSRLIAAQPSEIVSQLIIPADIAQILLRHP